MSLCVLLCVCLSVWYLSPFHEEVINTAGSSEWSIWKSLEIPSTERQRTRKGERERKGERKWVSSSQRSGGREYKRHILFARWRRRRQSNGPGPQNSFSFYLTLFLNLFQFLISTFFSLYAFQNGVSFFILHLFLCFYLFSAHKVSHAECTHSIHHGSTLLPTSIIFYFFSFSFSFSSSLSFSLNFCIVDSAHHRSGERANWVCDCTHGVWCGDSYENWLLRVDWMQLFNFSSDFRYQHTLGKPWHLHSCHHTYSLAHLLLSLSLILSCSDFIQMMSVAIQLKSIRLIRKALSHGHDPIQLLGVPSPSFPASFSESRHDTHVYSHSIEMDT